MAEEAIDNGDGGLEMRLEVASSSLAALVNIKPSRDPAPLVEEATKVLEAIRNESGDPLWLNEMEWRMGVAQTHALELWHHRRQMAEATKAYEAALGYFTRAAESRDQVPDTSTLVGRLYFHIGALHAVHRNDHRTAVKWYDKAEPLLSAERPTSALYVPRRDGEALVSMAVSYWDQDDYEHAVKLTESGAKLMEQAVASGVVEEKTLAVPYGNLSVMHKQLGNQAAALKFAKLADASKQVGTSAAGRPLPQQPSTTTPRPMAGGHPLPTGPSAPATSGVRTGVPAQRPQATTSGRTAMQQAAPTAVAPQEPRSASGRSKRPSASRTLLR
jgi:tetratricopeptide (TPR) repeat protein